MKKIIINYLLLLVIMKIRERNRTQDKELMQNKISHHLLTDVQPTCQWWSVPCGQVPPVYILGMNSWVWNIILKSPWFRIGTAEQPYHCLINIILILNQKYRVITDTRRKSNSIWPETRAIGDGQIWGQVLVKLNDQEYPHFFCHLYSNRYLWAIVPSYWYRWCSKWNSL